MARLLDALRGIEGRAPVPASQSPKPSQVSPAAVDTQPEDTLAAPAVEARLDESARLLASLRDGEEHRRVEEKADAPGEPARAVQPTGAVGAPALTESIIESAPAPRSAIARPSSAVSRPRSRARAKPRPQAQARPVRASDGPSRELASRVLAGLPVACPGVLLVTSAEGERAATAVVAAMASALVSQVTGELLAVDGNLTYPALTQRLLPPEEGGEGMREGLIDVLSGRVAWGEIVRRTAIERVGLLPGRLPGRDSPQALDLRAWAALLGALRGAYQLVLVDTPPLDARQTREIVRHADGICLVVRLGRTGRRAARRAVRVLRQCGGRVLGCVLAEPDTG